MGMVTCDIQSRLNSNVIPACLSWSIGATALLLGVLSFAGCSDQSAEGRSQQENVIPVSVVEVEKGNIDSKKTYSGTLSAKEEFVVFPKVSGRIESMSVDIGDTVVQGQQIATIDNDEFSQELKQAEADLAVAKAEWVQAQNLLTIAERENSRIVELKDKGMASEAQFDTSLAELLAAQAQLQVAEARHLRAESEVEAAHIQMSYTTIRADWANGAEERIVAERYLDAGRIVSTNDPLLLIVQIDSINAVIFVTEREYPLLSRGQSVVLKTDAFPGESFTGHIERVAPVFRENSRQARVEITIENEELRLKPGMFVRATVTLASAENVTIVPETALTERGGQIGVFRLDEDEKSVAWFPLTPGIRDGNGVEILDDDLSGKVVNLGQHLLDDGSPVVIAAIKGGVR